MANEKTNLNLPPHVKAIVEGMTAEDRKRFDGEVDRFTVFGLSKKDYATKLILDGWHQDLVLWALEINGEPLPDDVVSGASVPLGSTPASADHSDNDVSAR